MIGVWDIDIILIEGKLDWSRQTVHTYLARLIEKGLVSTKEKNKSAYLYYCNNKLRI
ncbi:MAG: BlaI/MecI/CopY family transcriptional regulator [Clostridiales bacterium]|nr:BlaI/MecI/CopY family transcriptional regulator [Clostridiales bacterium]